MPSPIFALPEQPVQLLPIQHHHLAIEVAGPLEALSFQAFLPQAEPAALPVEDLHRIAPSVGEDEQSLREGIL
jgi:hypothetical protein